MKKAFILLSFLLVSFALFAQSNWTFDDLMSNREKKRTGIKKLTPRQQEALQQWINKHFEVKESSFSAHLPTISEVMHSGKYLKLTDHSVWEIDPSDRPVVQGWLTPAKIKVKTGSDPEYPFLLVNQDTKTRVKAKKIAPLSE